MSYRQHCCICNKQTGDIKYPFCKTCYEIWYLPNKDSAWIKFLMRNSFKEMTIEENESKNIPLGVYVD